MRKLVRRFWGGLILLVLVVAVCVQLGREAFPMLNDYRVPIADYFSEQLGVDVDIGAIDARWVGLRPRLEFHDVNMRSRDGEDILFVGTVEGELSLVNSLREWQLVWRELEFSQLHMQFEQASNGRWNLGGLSLARPRMDEPRAVKDPLDIFLLSRHITLNESRFEFAFRTGHQAELSVPELLLENESDFHRLKGNFAVDGDKEAFAVVVEGHGNPRVEDNFEVQGYVALESFPMEKVVAALDIAAWDAAGEGQWSEGHRLDTKLWFSGNPYRDMTLQGQLRADGLPLKAPDSVELPAGLHTQVSGRWQVEKGWQLGLRQAKVLWNETTSPEFNMSVSGAFNRPLKVAVDRVDLAVWHALAEQTGLVQGKLRELLAELAPQGVLEDVHLRQRPAEEGHFYLRAKGHNLSAGAWRGAPAVEGVDGYLEASADGGRVVVNSDAGFSMFFPMVYHDPMAYERASGEVRWAVRRDLSRVEVFSGRLVLSGEEGEGRGYLHLVLPYGEQPHPGPEMTLLVGLRNSQARFHEKYVPYKVPDALYEWLQASVKAGDIDTAGFLWHGPLIQKDGEATQPAIQLFGSVDEAELKFSPEWPVLENARGKLVLDNRKLAVTIDEGVLAGNQLRNATINLNASPGEVPWLHVVGQASGGLSEAFHLLRSSPIAAQLGEGFAQWRGQGQVQAAVDLAIPLQQRDGAGEYDVQVQLSDAGLQLPELGLNLTQISGPLHYTSQAGLSSSGLDFNLWGKRGQAKMVTSQEPVPKLSINFSTAASIGKLADWLQQPLLTQFAKGTTAVEGEVGVAFGQGAKTTVDIRSDLKGVSVALPEPYGKPASDTRALHLTATVDESQSIKAAYGDLLRLHLLRDQQLQGLSLAFGTSFAPVEPGYADVSGRLGALDMQAWRSALQGLQAKPKPQSAQAQNAVGALEEWHLTPRFDLYLDALQLEQLALKQLYLSGEHRYQRWRLDVRSPHLYGEFFVFDDGRPMEVNLDSVKLPSFGGDESTAGLPASDGSSSVAQAEEASEDPVSVLKQIDLGRLPAVDFSVASLSAGEKDYGAWAFNLRPVDGGIVLHNLRGKALGLSVGGGAGDKSGAELVWLQSEQGNSTYINGVVSAQNLGEVLQTLGQGELLESQSAQFDLELFWPGAPDGLSLNNVRGTVALNIRDGRFIRGADAGNNPFLRLFGLLNFDTLARRLKLDFSDLLKEGMAFDSVAGTLQFADGQVVVAEPLKMTSPSSTLQFAGVLDATSEQLDANLVATLPVAGNLTVAAAFVGGLPAALGVYAVGKLFKEQVDKVSSIRYHISGAWSEPEIRVDRIFESSTAGEHPPAAPLSGAAGGSGEAGGTGGGLGRSAAYYRGIIEGETEWEASRARQ